MDPPTPIVCAHCGGANPKYRCSACLVARYRSRECMTADWPNHKKSCAMLPPPLRGVLFERAKTAGLAPHAAVTVREGSEEFHRVDVDRAGLPGFLKRGGSRLALTPGEFVQLVAFAVSEAKRQFLMVGDGDQAPWTVLKHTPTPPKWAPLLYEPCDDAAALALKAASGARGLWLMGPDRRGHYLGLGAAGPRRAPLAEWNAELMAGVARSTDPAIAIARELGELDPENFEARRAR